ncbi:ABC transporter ATP-binding protein [Microtetraspora malaysiensis]|uniref:ABC transporter ATP-binding protein n=1 Tax=Microtetraspora malaysiensis TaxID=161358 RepID=UPI003D8B65F8
MNADERRGVALRLLRVARPERWHAAGAIALGAGGVALTVTVPRLLGEATDLIVSAVADGRAVGFTSVGRVLLAALACHLAAFGFAYAQQRLTVTVTQRLVFRLRERAQAKLARLPMAYFDRHSRGDILSRAANDIDTVAQTLQQTLSVLVNALLTLVGVLAMMLWISPLLALVSLVAVPLSAVAARAVGARARRGFGEQAAATGRLNAHIEEMFTGHSLVKVFGRERQALRTFTEHNETAFRAGFAAQFVSGLIGPAMTLLLNVNFVLVAVIGGLRVAAGALSIGDVQAFIQYCLQFGQPINQAASMSALLQSVLASARRVFELLDEDEDENSGEDARGDSDAGASPSGMRGRVAFEDVSFRYVPDRPLIEGLSLVAEPGQTVAVVGPTGAGKTTLLNLLMRFYDVTDGRITLDGGDIARLPVEELRGRIGMVLQETWLFGGTLADNIAYGAGDVPRERIVEVARATGLDHLARTLPDGYDTVIDDEGAALSTGERQLVTIARAFLTDPAILVLDEATSALDTRTEVLVQRAMTSLRAGRTCFVIAHRLSTIRHADLILVMDSGRIVEQGTHDELVGRPGGAYAALYAAQFSGLPVGAAGGR